MHYIVSISNDNLGLKRPFQFSISKFDTREVLLRGSIFKDRYSMARYSYEADKVAQMIRVGGENILFLDCTIPYNLPKEEREKIRGIKHGDALEKFEKDNDAIIKIWNHILDTAKALDFIKNDSKTLQELSAVPIATIKIQSKEDSEADLLLKDRFGKLGSLYGEGAKANFNFYTKVL